MNITALIRSLATLGVCTFILVLAAPANAAPVSIDASQIDGDTGSDKFAIGLTRSITSRNYEGIADQSATLPYISAHWGDFYIEGLSLGYNISSDEGLNWGVLAVPRFLGYGEDSSTVLAGLGDTEYSYHGGVSANYQTGFGRFGVQALTDLLNESGGSEVIATLSGSYQFGDLTLSPAVSLNWQDATLVDHYYGVAPEQATADRSAYEGDSVVNASVALSAGYPLSDNLQVIGQTRLDQYGSAIKDSPLVDDDTTQSASIGFIYTF